MSGVKRNVGRDTREGANSSAAGDDFVNLVTQVMAKAKEVDKEYNIVYGAKKTAKDAYKMAQEIDEKHQVREKTVNAVRLAMAKAKEIDEEHKVVEKTKQAARSAYVTAKELDQKHKISETTSRELTKMMEQMNANDPSSSYDEEGVEMSLEKKISTTIDSISYYGEREKHYQTEVESSLAEAKQKKTAGDQNGALAALKKTKMYEAEINQIRKTKQGLEVRLARLMEQEQSSKLV